VGGVGDLRDEERGSHLGKSSSETDEETRSNEHAEVLGAGLQDGTNQYDGSPDNNTGLTSKTVGDIGSKGNSTESTNGLDGVEETEVSCSGVTEVL
jgi:hypothetical protein